MAGSGLFSKAAAARPHLVAGSGGVAGEIADLRADVLAMVEPLAAVVVEEFTNLAAASANSIKTAVASVATATTYSGAALNGSIGGGAISPPRNITVTTAGVTPADAPATATITGVDINGNVISEDIAVAQTATSAVGNKAFAKVTSIALTAGDGTGATLAFGTGVKVGLAKKIKTRAGLTGAIREIAAGAVVTTGTFAAAATGAPNGTWSPATAADGNNDYCLYYEADES